MRGLQWNNQLAPHGRQRFWKKTTHTYIVYFQTNRLSMGKLKKKDSTLGSLF